MRVAPATIRLGGALSVLWILTKTCPQLPYPPVYAAYSVGDSPGRDVAVRIASSSLARGLDFTGDAALPESGEPCRGTRPRSRSLSAVAAIPGIRELWAQTLGDPAICLALLDGPVDFSHPSLAGANLPRLQTLVCAEADEGPACRHGTHVASVIFGRHDGPVPGLSPRCRGLILPLFESADAHSFRPCSQLDLARAITQAVEHGAHLINVSAGQFSPSGTACPLLADVVRDCARRGVLIVAAVGNQGCECLHVPAALPAVLAVGAMNARWEPLGFSNWGGPYQDQGILAPGEGILGAQAGGGTARGT